MPPKRDSSGRKVGRVAGGARRSLKSHKPVKDKKRAAASAAKAAAAEGRAAAVGRLRGQQLPPAPAGDAAGLTPSPRGRAGGSVGAAKPRRKTTGTELKLRGPGKGSTASKKGKDGKVSRRVSAKTRRQRAKKVTVYAQAVFGYTPGSPLESPDRQALVNARLLPPPPTPGCGIQPGCSGGPE